MKSFKEYTQQKYAKGFICSGGPTENQFSPTEEMSEVVGFACAGGHPDKIFSPKQQVKENLNPKYREPEFINSSSSRLEDPEKDNYDEIHPSEIGVPEGDSGGYVDPMFNKEQAKNTIDLLRDTNPDTPNYRDYVTKYTNNSYNLNKTLFENENPPDLIKTNLDYDEDEYPEDESHPSMISLSKMDHLMRQHRLPRDMTVYSGLHFNPEEHRGKLIKFPAYTSTSLSPHVAKDFGSRNSYIHIMRLILPKNHHYLYTEHASTFPGQGEIILPRNIRMQFGHIPTHIITNKNLACHFSGYKDNKFKQIHFWNARIIPEKK